MIFGWSRPHRWMRLCPTPEPTAVWADLRKEAAMELDSLGVTHAEQQLYELLLHHPERTHGELAELTQLGETRLRGLLKSLADKGLLTKTHHRPARYEPAPPDIAVEVLALRRQQEI